MASRVVWQATGVMFILFGVFGKVSAVLASLPSPIMGAMTVVGLSMVTSVGLSNLQFIEMTSRNMLVFGLSLMLGIMIPYWVTTTPGAINTGKLDQRDQLYAMAYPSMHCLHLMLQVFLSWTRSSRPCWQPGCWSEAALVSF